jgi:hypothetical protein
MLRTMPFILNEARAIAKRPSRKRYRVTITRRISNTDLVLIIYRIL